MKHGYLASSLQIVSATRPVGGKEKMRRKWKVGFLGVLTLAATGCTSDTNYGQSQVEPKKVDNANQRRDTTEPGSYGTPTGKDGKSMPPSSTEPAPAREAPAK